MPQDQLIINLPGFKILNMFQDQFSLKKPFFVLKKIKNLADSEKWYTQVELLGTAILESYSQGFELTEEMETVEIPFRT